jgi:hypothetical protein
MERVTAAMLGRVIPVFAVRFAAFQVRLLEGEGRGVSDEKEPASEFMNMSRPNTI